MGAALPLVLLGTAVAGAGLSAASSYGSMQAQSANAAYQAQVAQNNAKIANQNASMDIQAGEARATQSGMKTRATVGTMLANQGASGVSVNTGSFPKTRQTQAQIGAMDALNIRSTAAKQAYAQEVAATSDTAESQLLSAESSQASDIAPVSALGTFLGGVSSAGGSYAKYAMGATPTGSPSVSDQAIY